MNRGKSSAIIINAANEIFVDEFLKNNINFNDIVDYLKLVLKDKNYIKTSNLSNYSIKNIYTIDSWARKIALKIIEKKNKLMLKIYFTLLYFIFFNLYGEIVQKLEVQGNKRISAETIKVYGDITLGKDYSNVETNKILKNLYNTNFFEDIKISITSGILKITVDEYPVINFIDLEGEKSNNSASIGAS